MTEGKQKYSLWLTPRGEAAHQLQALISKLADTYEAPVFTPHITLVGQIGGTYQAAHEKTKVSELANKVGRFTVSLAEYGFMDEKYRCLYLLADPAQLDPVYEQAAVLFPQVDHEHFRQLPHLSLMYGQYDTDAKQAIIEANPIEPITFEVQSLDLYLTNGPVNTWREVHSAELTV